MDHHLKARLARQSKVLVSPGKSMSMEDLKEREKRQKKNKKSKKESSTKKATSKTINCENETSEDETNESHVESMGSSLMVRKFDFILYKILGKEKHFSFRFNISRSKITLHQEVQN